MVKKDSVKTILVELDSLLDTRLGTIHLLNPTAAFNLYNSKEYYDRLMDDWETLTGGVISNEQFKEAYGKRTIDNLAVSRPTHIPSLLNKITIDLNDSKITSPDIEQTKLGVNIYPYVLTREEKETLKSLVYTFCDFETLVTIENYSLSEITPALLRDQWDCVILYNFNEWFCEQVNELDKVLIPRNILFSAALLVKPLEELEKEIPQDLRGIGPFSIIEMSFIERLGLELIKAKEFSIKKA